MTFLLAVVCLLAGLGAGYFVLRKSRNFQSLDVAVNTSESASHNNFSLSRSLLLVGPEVNDSSCSEQRRELKRILGPLLQAKYKIIEIYGNQYPAENGEPYEWLDNQLLRETLSAEDGFHLIFVDAAGKTAFHSGQPVVAEALLHIFDLWDFITEENGEELTNVEEVVDNNELPAEDPPVVEQVALLPAPAEAATTTEYSLPPLMVEMPAEPHMPEPEFTEQKTAASDFHSVVDKSGFIPKEAEVQAADPEATEEPDAIDQPIIYLDGHHDTDIIKPELPDTPSVQVVRSTTEHAIDRRAPDAISKAIKRRLPYS